MSLSIALDGLSPDLKDLVKASKDLFTRHFAATGATRYCCAAPGRVNLIGEHTDYTAGFCLPLAIDYSTVLYGSACSIDKAKDSDGVSGCTVSFVSTFKADTIETETITIESKPPSCEEAVSWKWYVIGTIAQYLKDFPQSTHMNIKFALSGNVPLGSGLSSSASLEVVVARFLECILDTNSFSSEPGVLPAKGRAQRCQKAENEWCYSPCGIMDQYAISAASLGSLLLIDCKTNDFTTVAMKQPNNVCLIITNSKVTHTIAGEESEYSKRVRQCKRAIEVLQEEFKKDLRSASVDQVEAVKEKLGDPFYRRARHVVKENARVNAAKEALEQGEWAKLGNLMNESHDSLRDDYEVSCVELDCLVDIAREQKGVYGSRMTGGGFGGCTVTLVDKDEASALKQALSREYRARMNKECDIFETTPADGVRLLGTELEA